MPRRRDDQWNDNEFRKGKSMEMHNEIDVFWGDSDLYIEKTIQSRKRRKKENRSRIARSEVYREIDRKTSGTSAYVVQYNCLAEITF